MLPEVHQPAGGGGGASLVQYLAFLVGLMVGKGGVRTGTPTNLATGAGVVAHCVMVVVMSATGT